jgi:hypothetical protein
MALLTTGDWYQITIRQTNAAQWGGMAFPPGVPAALMLPLVAGTTLTVFVIDSVSGQFAFEGGTALGFDDVLLASSAAITGHTLTGTDSSVWEWAEDGTDSYMYDSASGTVRKFDNAATTAFKAFLP